MSRFDWVVKLENWKTWPFELWIQNLNRQQLKKTRWSYCLVHHNDRLAKNLVEGNRKIDSRYSAQIFVAKTRSSLESWQGWNVIRSGNPKIQHVAQGSNPLRAW